MTELKEEHFEVIDANKAIPQAPALTEETELNPFSLKPEPIQKPKEEDFGSSAEPSTEGDIYDQLAAKQKMISQRVVQEAERKAAGRQIKPETSYEPKGITERENIQNIKQQAAKAEGPGEGGCSSS